MLNLSQMAGHDVATVPGQGLSSAPDNQVIEVCQQEERCLVTADRGFGNRARYVPSDYAGIVVVRLPNRATFADWQAAIDTLILGLEQSDVVGKLWMVQGAVINEYQPITEEEK
ncbi:MAG: DUF5615 family PIN-like protein [Cyanobacteria bacterium P01_D01_bin.44]